MWVKFETLLHYELTLSIEVWNAMCLSLRPFIVETINPFKAVIDWTKTLGCVCLL